MHVDRMTLARARRALREAASRIYDPNVTLIDFGHGRVGGETVADKLAVRFHVRRKLGGAELETAAQARRTGPVPARIGDFPTDVIEGTFRPQPAAWTAGGWGAGRRRPAEPRARRADPMKGGVSISDERHEIYGTLGGLVVDRATGEEMILSNWHVLAADWRARPGQRIYQPGRLDGGTSADTVATLSADAMDADLDAAVATLDGSRRLVGEQLDLGAVRGVASPELGMEVVKSGRRSGVTHGIVRGVAGMARVSYGHLDRVIQRVVTIEARSPREEVSAPGDSGSWWLEGATMRAVGLHFAGGDSPEHGLAVDMQAVLDSLGVDIVVEHRGLGAVPRFARMAG
jgi:endonuclease G